MYAFLRDSDDASLNLVMNCSRGRVDMVARSPATGTPSSVSVDMPSVQDMTAAIFVFSVIFPNEMLMLFILTISFESCVDGQDQNTS